MLAEAAAALETVEAALQELQGGANLAPQEIDPGERAARTVLRLRQELRRVLGNGADLLAAIVAFDRILNFAADVHYAAQRAQVCAGPGVAIDDPPQGVLAIACAVDIRIAHGVIHSALALGHAYVVQGRNRCRTPTTRSQLDYAQRAAG